MGSKSGMGFLIAGFLAGAALAEVHHGVWFWGSTTLPDATASPYGSIDVVGDAAKEDDTIIVWNAYKVKRVYGSYQNRPVSEPAVIADWNGKLDAAGIMSQLLIDGDAVNDAAYMSNILNKVTNRLINFNMSLGTNEHQKFDGLHLDLEPQKLSLWDTGTVAVKRGLLSDLEDAYASIRSLLDSSGMAGFPMYADIPFFWDKLPADGGSVGWTNAADRDGWYASLTNSLAGVSVMTFSKDSFSSVETATDYERSGVFGGPARIAIQGKVGPTEVWTNYIHFTSTLNELDDEYGPDEATDIENYGFWRYTIENFGPVLTNAPVITLTNVSVSGVNVEFVAKPGHHYTVKSSTNYVDWEVVRTGRTVSADYYEVLNFPVLIPEKFSVIQIEELADPE